MVTHRSFVVGILLGAAVLAAGCGSGSSGATAGKSSATQDSSTYRAAVNALFGSIVAARGEYESGQGTPALRSAAETIQHADEEALTQLHALQAPSSATALHAQLAATIAAQARAVRRVLAAAKFDTGRLGDAVRQSVEIERVVDSINALP